MVGPDAVDRSPIGHFPSLRARAAAPGRPSSLHEAPLRRLAATGPEGAID